MAHEQLRMWTWKQGSFPGVLSIRVLQRTKGVSREEEGASGHLACLMELRSPTGGVMQAGDLGRPGAQSLQLRTSEPGEQMMELPDWHWRPESSGTLVRLPESKSQRTRSSSIHRWEKREQEPTRLHLLVAWPSAPQMAPTHVTEGSSHSPTHTSLFQKCPNPRWGSQSF